MSGERTIWQDVECGGYRADLPLWEELASEHGGPVLDLGCGAGRVTAHLARSTETNVVGLDRDEELVSAARRRTHGFGAGAALADVRGFALGRRFKLALAPMQLIQLLPEASDRQRCLACVAEHLEPGGIAAFAVVEALETFGADEVALPAPDVREVEGRVYSSLPLPPVTRDGEIVLRRLRQVVSPDGALAEEDDEVRLQAVAATTLEGEGEAAGLEPAGRREVPATDAHVGSTVILLEAS